MSHIQLLTVIVATYNQSSFLCEALDSLLAQTFPRKSVEVIVINDGSTDATVGLLSRYEEDFRIVSRERRGLIASCNEGLALANGRYFARLDSDDFAHPSWLARLVYSMEAHKEASCACPDRYEIHGNEWRLVRKQEENIYSMEACGTLFRTDLLREIGGFRPFFWEEYDLYLRLLNKGRFLHVDEPLYMYRRHGKGMTSDSARRRAGWEELVREWGVDYLRAAGSDPELETVIRQAGL